MNRYKVVEIGYATKTVLERFDPTTIRKNTGEKTISTHSTINQVKRKIIKLEEQKQAQYDEMEAYHAPSECYSVIPKRDYQVIDTKTGKRYDAMFHPETDELILHEAKRPVFGKWEM